MKKYIFELPKGLIIWCGDVIVGITGVTLPEELIGAQATPVGGHGLDWELLVGSLNEEQMEVLKTIEAEQAEEIKEEYWEEEK